MLLLIKLQVIVHWPFCSMNKAFKPEYTDIEWEYNMEEFERWAKGNTGFPIGKPPLSTGLKMILTSAVS